MRLRKTSVRSVIGACAVALIASAAPNGRSHAGSRAGRGPRHSRPPRDRPGAFRGAALALARPRPRRTVAGRRRQQQPPARVLLRRDRRRPVEDDRRRVDVAAGLRQLLQVVLGRRRRRRRVEPRRRLRRHGRDRAPRQHHPGRRRLQVDRRRQDVDARRPREDAWPIAGSASTRPNPDVVYVAALGDPYGPNPERGVFKIDRRRQDLDEDAVPRRQDRRGRSCRWTRRTRTCSTPASGRSFRTPHSLSSGGPGSGLFKSTDGGEHWTELTKNPGLPKPLWGKVGVVGLGRRPQPRLRDHRSRGRRRLPLRRRRRDVEAGQRRPPAAPARVLLHAHLRRPAGEGHGLRPQHRASTARPTPARSIRGIRVPHGDNHDLWIAPNDPKRMINSNDGGANVSVNAGETLDRSGLSRPRSSTTSSRRRTCRITSAARSRTTARPACPSTGDGRAVRRRRRRERLHRAGSAGHGRLLRRQLRRAADAHQPPHRRAARDQRLAGQPDGLLVGRHHRALPVDVPDRDRAHRSDDALRHVAARLEVDQRRPELAAHQPGPDAPRSVDARAVGRADHARSDRRRDLRDDLHARAVAVDGNVIWAGSDDGSCTSRATAARTGRTSRRRICREFTRISLIEASPHDAGTAYLAGNRYQRSDRAPYVYKTDDYGKTWTKIVNGLPADDFARAIREDTKRNGLLFLGTETGIYVSFDDGGDVAVAAAGPAGHAGARHRGQERRPRDRHARPIVLRRWTTSACCGRSARETTNEPVVLFHPVGRDPSVSRGVAIDYYLKQAADKVTIEILDAQGKTIATFTGTPPAEPRRTRRPRRSAGRGAETRKAADAVAATARGSTVKQGMNRFTWDMRYPERARFPGLIMWAGSTRGPAGAARDVPGQADAPPASRRRRTSRSSATRPCRRHRRRSAASSSSSPRQINDKVTVANEAVLRIRSLKDSDRGSDRQERRCRR